MRRFIYSLMTDKKGGVLFSPFKFALYVLSLCYRLGIFARGLLYKFRIFKRNKVPLKVISVGNLTLGGTGKTPFVVMLAKILKDTFGREGCVLIRGYGWDEQAMLKNNLPDVPILVGEDRVKASGRAIKLYGSDTAVLDDGFQYWELERDLDIVLIDSRKPFGNGHLFPRGILREPKRAVGRADIVVFTKVNKKLIDIAGAQDDLKKSKRSLIFLEAAHKPKYLYDAKARRTLEISFLNGKRAILLSSIGDPNYFEETAKDLGADVIEHFIFPDHHNYRKKDVERIKARCDEREFDLILTTEKDAIKLNRMSFSFGNYTLMTLIVEMEIAKSSEEILIDRLHSLYNS